jgi:hypothetical protein
VLASVGQPTTNKVGLFYHHARAFAAMFRGDLNQGLQHLDDAHSCIERLPGMLHDPLTMKSAISVEVARSSLTFQLQSPIPALKGMQAFLGLLPSGHARVRAILLQRVQWLELVHAFETQQWGLWDELHSALEAEPAEGSFMAGSRAAVYVAIASMAMARGMARVALRWFERAFELRKFIEAPRTFQVMGVVYLTGMATLGDWEGMSSHVPRVRNMLSRRGMPEGIVRELGLACLGIAREPAQRMEILSAFLELLISTSKGLDRAFDYGFLNLRDWVEMQTEQPQ